MLYHVVEQIADKLDIKFNSLHIIFADSTAVIRK